MLLVILFGCIAFLAASEMAFFSLSPAQIREISSKKSGRYSTILQLLDHPKRLLATQLIAVNLVNVSIIILITFLTASIFDLGSSPVLAFILEVILISALLLVIGEILPKIFASYEPVRVASFTSRPLVVLNYILYPFSYLLVGSTSFIDRRIAKKGYPISITELSKAVEITSREGTHEEEKKILKGIVQFGDIDVSEIMQSRMDVTAADEEMDFRQLLKVIIDSGYSRIPVYKESFDHITGILYVKDVLPHLDEKAGFPWQKLLREAYFVPENKKINDLLAEFQQKKIHMAIVVDEYGGTSGIVTLEDIIEEIVGEISDEYDTETDQFIYSRIDDHTWVFEGKTPLNDLCKILQLENNYFDPFKGEADSLAGMILEKTGSIPEPGITVGIGKFTMTVEATDKKRIKRVRITAKPGEPAL